MYDVFMISEKGPDKPENEDFAKADAQAGIFLVADGMGGRAGASRASTTVGETFFSEARQLPVRADSSALRNVVLAVNERIRDLSDEQPEFEGMGSTLSAVILEGAKGKIIHIGDSRIYLARAGALQQLTRDHTVTAELVARRHLSPEGARHHPFRNMLSRSIGTSEGVEPDIDDIELAAGDRLILATDGLTKSLDKDALAEVLQRSGERGAEATCRDIMAAANRSPLSDDVTTVVVELVEGAHG